jgi:hypothetical protein
MAAGPDALSLGLGAYPHFVIWDLFDHLLKRDILEIDTHFF